MGEYRITFARSASKELEALPAPVGARVLAKIEDLATSPRPAGCRKLAASNNLWRLRVGDYRVVYSMDDAKHVVDIIAIRHRRDAYR